MMPARVPGLRASDSVGRADRASLAHAAHAGGQAHAESGADGNQVEWWATFLLREDRDGETEGRQGHEERLQFPHSSPASLKLAASGWLRLTVPAEEKLLASSS